MTRMLAAALLAAAPAAAILPAAPAAAEGSGEARIEVGYLRCEMTDRTNFVIVSSSGFDCTFSRDGMEDERYRAEITSVGVDLTIKQAESLRWAVIAPTEAQDETGLLEGEYGGVAASAALTVGVGAKALLGGFDKSIALQPISVSGQEGVGASVGVEGLQLTLAE
jgi:hypothetical protein